MRLPPAGPSLGEEGRASGCSLLITAYRVARERECITSFLLAHGLALSSAATQLQVENDDTGIESSLPAFLGHARSFKSFSPSHSAMLEF